MWTDEDGLHLKIDHRDGKWFCAEVLLGESLGYGQYTFRLASRIDSMDFRTVAAGFIYESEYREVDVEFSRVLADPANAQYVVQPYETPGNLMTFVMPITTLSSHRFVWRPDGIEFTSWSGHDQDPPQDNIIHAWVYTGPDIPPPGAERMRFNVWLFGGQPPVTGQEDEMVISAFGWNASEDTEELAYGVPLEGEVSPDSDRDLYHFEGVAGDRVEITVISRSGWFDPRLRLWDPEQGEFKDQYCRGEGQVLGNWIPTTCSFSVEIVLEVSGTYRLEVSDQGSNDSGGYRIDLQQLSP